MLTEYGAQRRLCELAGRFENVGHVDDGLVGGNDAEVDHRIYFHGHVVLRDHVLRRDVHDVDAQVDYRGLLQERDEQDQARALDGLVAAQEEHDAAFVLLQDLDGVGEKNDDEHADKSEDDFHTGLRLRTEINSG